MVIEHKFFFFFFGYWQKRYNKKQLKDVSKYNQFCFLCEAKKGKRKEKKKSKSQWVEFILQKPNMVNRNSNQF